MFLNDKIIVLDIEATCWERGKRPPDMHNDIIEIGICKYVVATEEITEVSRYYIVPERSEISPFCTGLTGITPEIVAEKGIPFSEACRQINKQYNTDKRAWAAYGAYDKQLIDEHCLSLNVPNPFSDTFLNIKALFAYKNKIEKNRGLTEELHMINQTFEGTLHNGQDDAYNAAKLLRWILQ